jgi:capsule polysaccharide export protein KpsE/RkpR
MEGNSVVGAILNTALATLITLSVMSLSFAAYHTLMIRDAAISAASKAGRVDAPEQNRYLLRLLDTNLPDLAYYEVSPLRLGNFVGVSIRSQLPGFGFIKPPMIQIQAIAPRERVS